LDLIKREGCWLTNPKGKEKASVLVLSSKEQKEEERRRGGRSSSSSHSHWSELRKNIGEVSAVFVLYFGY
jgi:hypothetical protein